MNLQDVLAEHKLWLDTKGNSGKRANLIGAELINTNLSGANLSYANLIDANLEGANLRGANLIGVDLSRANLRGVDLRYAILSYADLEGANLRGANLIGANLRGANLVGANLIGVDLIGVDLSGYDLFNTIGDGSYIQTIQTGEYHINITDTNIQIGCKNYSKSEWMAFTDKEILEMDGRKALTFWKKWKNILKLAIEDTGE